MATTVRTRTATGRSSIQSTTTGGTSTGSPERGSLVGAPSRSSTSSEPRLRGLARRNACTARRSPIKLSPLPFAWPPCRPPGERSGQSKVCPIAACRHSANVSMDAPAGVGWASMNPHGIRAFAPGRVNLIGEHTDYNDGLCLPFAIELGVTVTAELHDGGESRRPASRTATPSSRARSRSSAAPASSSRAEARHRRRPATAGRALLLGGPVRGARARPLRRRRRRAAPTREARAAVLTDRERVGRPGHRPARPARLAARRGGPRAAAGHAHARGAHRPARPARPRARGARLRRAAQPRRLRLQRAPRGVPARAGAARRRVAARRRRRLGPARPARTGACAT